jgi:hypothetical protein
LIFSDLLEKYFLEKLSSLRKVYKEKLELLKQKDTQTLKGLYNLYWFSCCMNLYEFIFLLDKNKFFEKQFGVSFENVVKKIDEIYQIHKEKIGFPLVIYQEANFFEKFLNINRVFTLDHSLKIESLRIKVDSFVEYYFQIGQEIQNFVRTEKQSLELIGDFYLYRILLEWEIFTNSPPPLFLIDDKLFIYALFQYSFSYHRNKIDLLNEEISQMGGKWNF